MKVVLVLLSLFGGAIASRKETPIDKVVKLIEDLASQIEKDGKKEQASYDHFACWVEDTLQRKASDISSAKELLEELDESILKGKAEIASHGAEIAQLEKDIAQNEAAVKEATAIRDKDHKEYAGERAESEQCIGALEAATKVLTGAGTKKEGGFLQQAELMSVTGGIKQVLQRTRVLSVVSEADLTVMRNFVQHPGAFAKGGMIAAQTGQNPFGDYAPQSSQIQGILKGMYDAFTADLEKDNVEEAGQEKSFQELFGTKIQELETLKATLQRQETNQATATKKLAEDEALRDDTTEQLAADEKFFADTKESAETKATEWSVRTRLRTEELAGMEGAIQILSGGSETFHNATENGGGQKFLQLKSVHTHNEAYGELKSLAAKYHSSRLARLVTVMKSGGHFDKVIFMIDEMIALLRKEEQADIEHRDRCENSQNANGNEMEDVESEIKKSDKKLERLDNTVAEKKKELKLVEGDIVESKVNMNELLDQRNEDHADFKFAVKMDTDAIALIEQAIVKLSKYYKENKIPLSMAQAPEYSQDPDKAPETSFSGSDAHQGESTGIVAILSMIKEDLQKEIKEGKADDAKGQEQYEQQSGALQDSLDAQRATKVSLEKELAALGESISSVEKYKKDKNADKDSEEDMEKALMHDCSWVKDNFESRRKSRKTEIAGLVEAKDFLAGVEAGDAVLPIS